MKASLRNCAKGISTYQVLLFFFLLSCLSAAYAEDVAPLRGVAGKVFMQRGSEQIAAFDVEIVSDSKARQQGLSGRSRMPADHGMLFILDSAAENFFWMKGMEFPIDILFFSEDKSLTEVLPKLMPCKACRTYKVPPHTAYALEINAGLAETLGVRTGDRFVDANK